MTGIRIIGALLIMMCLSLRGGVSEALAQSTCTPLNNDIPVGSGLASAGFFANLRNADNSINFLMDELISKSEVQAQRISSEQRTCPRSCSQPVVAIVFTSTPNRTLDSYDESTSCAQYQELTTASPIVYANRTFDSQSDAESWYEDMTQGNGIDGEDLYGRCPGKCSPAYSSVIYQRNQKFVVTTSIVCGHARDKDDNQYRLTASVRWICP
jgi:hypothetical protein